MRLQAISAGTGRSDRPLHRRRAQRLPAACNIRTDGGELLALLAPELGNAPHGVRVGLPSGLAFVDHLRAGQRVGCRAAVLRVAGTELRGRSDRGGGLAKRARDARSRSRPAPRSTSPGRPRGGARSATAGAGRDPLMDAVHDRGLALARRRAARSIATGPPPRCARLIGCGPGLTPAGDDLIVGFLAGLWSTRGRRSGAAAFSGPARRHRRRAPRLRPARSAAPVCGMRHAGQRRRAARRARARDRRGRRSARGRASGRTGAPRRPHLGRRWRARVCCSASPAGATREPGHG